MVSTVQELEACIGAPNIGVKMKTIDHMEDHATGWIAAAPLLSLITRSKDGRVRATLGGGDPGFARATGPNTLTIKTPSLDRIDDIVPGDGAAALFIAPGITETLRIAGRVASVTADEITFDVNECFVHCGKALIRSHFWQAAPQPQDAELPNAARFLVLGTAGADGSTDASPKGDPAGFLAKLGDNTIALPDRTGNRLAYGHRNIIAHDRVALVAFAPGSTQAFELAGRAWLTNDQTVLSPMAVEGKAPLLATLIEADTARTYASQALARARIWDAERQNEDHRPNPAAALTAHIKASREQGVVPAALRLAITAGATEKALKADYKANLY
jgi:predicted pyridoxine 5'-phosphate oxidase superfamily flavin-nucleotide-binding protein